MTQLSTLLKTKQIRYHSNVVIQQWTQQDIDIVCKEFFEVDNRFFGGKLFTYGVRVQFEPTTISKWGTYYPSTKVIILNACGPIQQRIATLWHEMIHAYSHSNGHDDNHNNWFWFTLGQLSALRGQPISANMSHQCPSDIILNHKG